MSKKSKRLEAQDSDTKTRYCECNLKNIVCKCDAETDCYDHGLGTCPEVHLCSDCLNGIHERRDPSPVADDEWAEIFA